MPMSVFFSCPTVWVRSSCIRLFDIDFGGSRKGKGKGKTIWIYALFTIFWVIWLEINKIFYNEFEIVEGLCEWVKYFASF